jgi:hypothetical protein
VENTTRTINDGRKEQDENWTTEGAGEEVDEAEDDEDKNDEEESFHKKRNGRPKVFLLAR